MGSMIMIIQWITIIIRKIIPINVIYKSVVIIIEFVSWNFGLVFPHIGRNILMRVINPRINDCDNNILTSLCCCPGFGGIDISICNSFISCRIFLSYIMKIPELPEFFIIWKFLGSLKFANRYDVIGFRIFNKWVLV